MTNAGFVSRIVNDIKALNKDEHISRRYILNIGRSKATYLMSQKLSEISLFREDNLLSVVRCFELKKDDIVKCNIVEFKRCTNLMKSKKKLPKLLYSRFGNSIVSVLTLDGLIKYHPVTLNQYAIDRQRNFSKFVTKNYYYVQDGYLYLIDSEVEAVDVVLITLEKEKVEDISSCKSSDSCKSVWEHEFVCSDKLIEVVIQETLKEILSSNKQIMEDENPNLTEIQKDRTTQ